MAERQPLSAVLAALFAAGGSVVDSSPMYGRAEGVAGDLLAEAGTRDKAFIATKVWTRGRAEGIAQMERSFQLFKTKKIDLMQVHNLVDCDTHLQTLRAWKAEGRIGYIGVTHYTSSAYGDLEAVLRRETPDFVQLNYAMDDRAAEKTILPLAAEKGIAVIINRPFGGGGLLRSLKGRALPSWAAEIGCTSWAQILLKFIISHPAVTCAIPGTGKPEHMLDNLEAGRGPLPNTSMRETMAASIAS
jgi:diketogulonate reductase-like aldo/keto reductase